ncbi:hypothetical protein QQG74_25540 [Micromonospora sp. FIMYZ51]|uniref:hypothetical protein n=1 Tax=Micromonospora sp. FIMYZ51 TaxID=3051832 RepID=UPI00311E4C4C
MAKHRAPVDDLLSQEEGRSQEERTDVAGYRLADRSRWPTAWPERSPYDPEEPPARPSVVGVARVPATSQLTPPGRELRNQGPRAIPPRGPAAAPRPVGRHRRAGAYGS